MTTKKRAGGAGRKPYAPTNEQRLLVRNLAGVGLPTEQIRQVIPWGRPDNKPIDSRTLMKHFKGDLVQGIAVADMKLRTRIFNAALEGNTAALIFLCKARLGMKETQVVESTGKDGAPLPVAMVAVYLPAKDPSPEFETGAGTHREPVTHIDVAARTDDAALPLARIPTSLPLNERRSAPGKGGGLRVARAVGRISDGSTMYPAAADPRIR